MTDVDMIVGLQSTPSKISLPLTMLIPTKYVSESATHLFQFMSVLPLQLLPRVDCLIMHLLLRLSCTHLPAIDDVRLT
jgi:hypothetical protein